jgi:hypothetical protein
LLPYKREQKEYIIDRYFNGSKNERNITTAKEEFEYALLQQAMF